MARNPEKDLYDLIKSLSKGERKTFTLFANYYSGGDKKYLLLFTLIDSQKQYDENKIIQKLREAKIFTHLPSLKIYLMELILKALRFHHSEKNTDSKLRNYMADIEIYHAKGLVSLRDKTFRKAKYLAAKHENYEASLLSLNKEFISNHIETGVGVLDEYEEVNRKISLRLKYRRLIYKCLKYEKGGPIREEKMKIKWDKIINDPLLLNEPPGYVEKYLYNQIWISYGINNNDFKKCRTHAGMQVKHIESYSEWRIEDKSKYIIAIANFIFALSSLQETEKARAEMNKLLLLQKLKLDAKEKDCLADTIMISYSNLLSEFVTATNFSKALQLASEAEAFIKGKSHDYPSALLLFFNLASVYLNTGSYKSALIWVNMLLNKSNYNDREDTDIFARIFNLIIHYELKHDELVPYLVRSTYRFLHKRKKLYKTEDAILRFIRNKLPKANSQKELNLFFKDLKSEIREITKNPYEARILEYFDFISWLESKTTNKTMVEVLKEKNNKK